MAANGCEQVRILAGSLCLIHASKRDSFILELSDDKNLYQLINLSSCRLLMCIGFEMCYL